MKRIPSLDGLRAISIILVLLGHLAGTRNFLAQRFAFDDAADFGVRVFFVISGYLITLLLVRERQTTGTISLKEFYRRRAFRIFPAAYVYILAIVLFSWSDITKPEILASCFYLANFVHLQWPLAHLWSLSVEEQFYLIWPAVIVLAYRRAKTVAITAIAAAPVLRALFYVYGWKDVNHYFPTVCDAIAAGCLVALVSPQLSRWAHLLRSRWCLIFPAIAIAMALVDYWNRKCYNAVGLTIMHACIGLSIYAATQVSDGVLNSRPLTWLGRASYSIYLWQMPFCNRYSHEWWAAFPTNLLLAVTLGCASFYWVERPILKFRERRKVETASAVAQGRVIDEETNTPRLLPSPSEMLS